jgi:restriction system protein
MTEYFRIMPGKKSLYAQECINGNFIGGDWNVHTDLTDELPETWKAFNKVFIPQYLESHPGKSKIAAGLAGGMLHSICKGVKIGDIVLMSDQQGTFHFGKVTSDYWYAPDGPLQHRRSLQWLPVTVHRHDFSEALQNSLGSIGTLSNVTRHEIEIKAMMGGATAPSIIATNSDIEDPSTFALERHLEDFLVANWAKTELGKTFDIFTEDGEKVGQQYPSDTGPLDILAVSKDGKELLVIELKRGRVNDRVVGQIQRYMGYIKDEIAEPGQSVRGIIIALDDDQGIRRALSVATNIEFYRYNVDFHLHKA